MKIHKEKRIFGKVASLKRFFVLIMFRPYGMSLGVRLLDQQEQEKLRQ